MAVGEFDHNPSVFMAIVIQIASFPFLNLNKLIKNALQILLSCHGVHKAGRWCESILKVRVAQRWETCLVLAIVLLRVAQDPVAESQHVLEVSIALVSQILQPQYWTITLICERSLQNTKDLQRQKVQVAMGSLVSVPNQ